MNNLPPPLEWGNIVSLEDARNDRARFHYEAAIKAWNIARAEPSIQNMVTVARHWQRFERDFING